MLGTGAAAGLPVYGCACELCVRALQQPELQRTACSALLEVNEKKYLIDAGQTNLTQCFPAGTLSAILLTHFHPDHVQGLFHLRWGSGLRIPVYCPPDSEGCADLYKHPGILQFNKLKKWMPIQFGPLTITPLPLVHSRPTFGYCFELEEKRIAYLTDTKGLPPSTEKYLAQRNLDLLVVDCTYEPGFESRGHNNLDDVLQMEEKIRPQSLVLTHIGHEMDQWLLRHADDLPQNMSVGWDGLVLLSQ